MLVSVASIWEIELKKSIGKLDIDPKYITFVKEYFEILDITLNHILRLESLENTHNDPCNRILSINKRRKFNINHSR